MYTTRTAASDPDRPRLTCLPPRVPSPAIRTALAAALILIAVLPYGSALADPPRVFKLEHDQLSGEFVLPQTLVKYGVWASREADGRNSIAITGVDPSDPMADSVDILQTLNEPDVDFFLGDVGLVDAGHIGFTYTRFDRILFSSQHFAATFDVNGETLEVQQIVPTQPGFVSEPRMGLINPSAATLTNAVFATQTNDSPSPPNHEDGTVAFPILTDPSQPVLGTPDQVKRDPGTFIPAPGSYAAGIHTAAALLAITGIEPLPGTGFTFQTATGRIENGAITFGDKVPVSGPLISPSESLNVVPTDPDHMVVTYNTINNGTGREGVVVAAFALNETTDEYEQIGTGHALRGFDFPRINAAAMDTGAALTFVATSPITGREVQFVSTLGIGGNPISAPHQVSLSDLDAFSPQVTFDAAGNLTSSFLATNPDNGGEVDVGLAEFTGLGRPTTTGTQYANPLFGFNPDAVFETEGDAAANYALHAGDSSNVVIAMSVTGEGSASFSESFDSFINATMPDGANGPGEILGVRATFTLDIEPVELVLDNQTTLSVEFTQSISGDGIIPDFDETFGTLFDVNSLTPGVMQTVTKSFLIDDDLSLADWAALLAEAQQNGTIFDTTNLLHLRYENTLAPNGMPLDPLILVDNIQIDLSFVRSGASAIPEPATLALMGLAGVTMFRRRRAVA